jgi:protein-tyrosine phosphatase
VERLRSEDTRILFVCTGNTCRSPLAAALAQANIEASGWTARVESAGTNAQDDAPATDLARLAAHEAGLDLEGHRARLLTRPDVLQASLVLVMSERHREFIRVLAPEAMERVHTLRAFASGGTETGEVADPYGGDLALYRRTIAELRQLVDRSLQRWHDGAVERR